MPEKNQNERVALDEVICTSEYSALEPSSGGEVNPSRYGFSSDRWPLCKSNLDTSMSGGPSSNPKTANAWLEMSCMSEKEDTEDT